MDGLFRTSFLSSFHFLPRTSRVASLPSSEIDLYLKRTFLSCLWRGMAGVSAPARMNPMKGTCWTVVSLYSRAHISMRTPASRTRNFNARKRLSLSTETESSSTFRSTFSLPIRSQETL